MTLQNHVTLIQSGIFVLLSIYVAYIVYVNIRDYTNEEN